MRVIHFIPLDKEKGLGGGFKKVPMFVTDIIAESNTVVLGPVDALVRNSMAVSQLNWMKYDRIPDGFELTTQVRYNDKGTLSHVF